MIPKVIYRFNVLPINISMGFSPVEQTIVLTFIWNLKHSQNNLEKENKTGGITLPDFRVYYKAMVLASKQTHRPMEPNTDPRNKSTRTHTSIYN